MTESGKSRSRADRIQADDAELRHRIDDAVEALRTKDLVALEQLYTTDVVSFDTECGRSKTPGSSRTTRSRCHSIYRAAKA